jgi:hypothetical protein
MKCFCLLAILLTVNVACEAVDMEIVSTPSTGETNLAIAKEKKHGVNYCFIDTKTNQRLGDVLGDLHGARINDIKASWSPDGRNVAVFISYGTKLNTILLYSLSEDHRMKPVRLPDINPIATYDKRNPGQHFLEQAEKAAGYSENALGDWMTNDNLKIVRGDAVVDSEDDERARHFLIVLEVKIVGDRAQIVNQFLTGVLSNEQAKTFLSKWKH